MKETIQIEKLLSEYAPLMARIAATFEANKSLQDELIQEMSLAVWRAFEGASKGSDSGFRGEASVKTFVAKVAHNKAVDHVIKEQRRQEFTRDGEFDSSHTTSASSSRDATLQENAIDLMTGLRQLEIKYRQVLALLLEGFSQLEIANMLGIKETAVAKRVSRARQQLTQIMEQQP
nr:RNA polymerase sigma factor [Alteromonas macleodii]